MTPPGLETTKIGGEMNRPLQILLIVSINLPLAGCPWKYRDDLDYSYGVQQTLSLDEFPSNSLVQFESVAWDPESSQNCVR